MERLFEMANYYKDDLNLPVNLWLDEGETYRLGKHGKRIKFQINYMDKIREEYMCSMELNGEIPYKVYRKLSKSKEWVISSRDLERVRNFVVNNAYALDFLADQRIRRKQFDNLVIKGGNFASDEDVERQINLVDAVAHL